jgi:putative endonuclease
VAGRGDRGSTREKGRAAEDLAAAWLERRGFEVLARNHSTRRGEVDLVCRDGDVLCFVEVRSRASRSAGAPEETVDRRKALRVVAAATDWALRHGGLDQAMRFDVVAVSGGPREPRVEHFPGAFDAAGGKGP